jgi:hypothetical protein
MASIAFIHKNKLIESSGSVYEALQAYTKPLHTHEHLGELGN